MNTGDKQISMAPKNFTENIIDENVTGLEDIQYSLKFT